MKRKRHTPEEIVEELLRRPREAREKVLEALRASLTEGSGEEPS